MSEIAKIVDFTNKQNLSLLYNNKLICNNLLINGTEFKNIKNISYIVNETHSYSWKMHFIKHDNKIYFMDYFGNQYENICKKIADINDNINKKEYKNLNIKKGLILYNITKSAGHELCFIIAGIYLLDKLGLLNEYEIVISNAILNFGKFMKSILLLFFKENQIHFIDDNTIVNISESIIYNPPHYKVHEHNNVLLNKLNLNLNTNSYYKNVCLIKSTIDGNYLNTPQKCFYQRYLNLFKKNNFHILSPNDYDVITLFNIINNCDNIILSWGCNAWINSIFVNKKTNVMILCHKGYSNEYNKNYNYNKNNLTLCTPICNKLIMVYDLESDLNIDSEQKLQEHINILIK